VSVVSELLPEPYGSPVLQPVVAGTRDEGTLSRYERRVLIG
jgi:hypothetical protein